MRKFLLLLTSCGSLFAATPRVWYAGASAEAVIPYFWFTDSVYTYDSSVDWYRAVRYDFGVSPAFGGHAGFADPLSETWQLGVELGYTYNLPATSTITTQQQVGAVAVQIRETATLEHHLPRLSLRFVRTIAANWNIFWRAGLAYHIARRTIVPQPLNLASGTTLYPSNFPARDDTYAVFTADLAFGAEYEFIRHHGISLSLVINPPVVYPETVRNHIVMPYFATLAFAYRYLW